jgi:hypothetical protein
MNLETIALVEKILELGARAYAQVSDIIAREKSGDPLTTDELEDLRSQSDEAHETIQDWSAS